MRSFSLVLALFLNVAAAQAQPFAQPFDQMQVSVILPSGPLAPHGQLAYQVANVGFGDVDDVEASIWAVTGPQLVRLHNQRFGFIANGSSRAASNIPSPIKTGKFVLCIAYGSGADRFEVLHFYSNEHQSDPVAKAWGRLDKFRSTVTEANKSSGLCKAMPESAMRYLR
jgi:hypothetical protein